MKRFSFASACVVAAGAWLWGCGGAPPPEGRGAAEGASPAPEAVLKIVTEDRLDTGPWKVGVVDPAALPGEEGAIPTVAASTLPPEGRVALSLTRFPFDVAYYVVFFRDKDEDGMIDADEEMRRSRARATADTTWEGEGLFLRTPQVTLVGQAPWRLDEVEFVPVPSGE